jgi:hypothetical protein
VAPNSLDGEFTWDAITGATQVANARLHLSSRRTTSQSNIATAVNMLTANDKTLTIWAQLADALDQVLIDRHEVWMT